jgi:methyl-accepting chemotaxis protein
MTAGYAEAFEQVAGAAVRLASESESLAQGVSAGTAPVSPAQRAATEPTAAGVAGEARQLANQSAEGLKSLECTGGGSDRAAGKIASAAQAVEEIAFQANLLALSAAVEAARPSGSGAGFAAVADEVGSLAQRCAEASRRIAGLARESVCEVRSGESEMEECARLTAASSHPAAARGQPPSTPPEAGQNLAAELGGVSARAG